MFRAIAAACCTRCRDTSHVGPCNLEFLPHQSCSAMQHPAYVLGDAEENIQPMGERGGGGGEPVLRKAVPRSGTCDWPHVAMVAGAPSL